MNFLLSSFFSSSWFLIIIVILAMGLLILTSFTRRKKEEDYRNELSEKIVKGAKVKTYGGLYGTVVSVRNTTDGKIVLLETGEGNQKSYQQLHINAIYGLDESEEMVIDSEGNEVPLSELNNPKTEEPVAELEAPEISSENANAETTTDNTNETVAENTEVSSDNDNMKKLKKLTKKSKKEKAE